MPITRRARLWKFILDDLDCTHVLAALAMILFITIAGVMYGH